MAFILVENVGIYEIKIKHGPREKMPYLFSHFGFATKNYTINSITKTQSYLAFPPLIYHNIFIMFISLQTHAIFSNTDAFLFLTKKNQVNPTHVIS